MSINFLSKSQEPSLAKSVLAAFAMAPVAGTLMVAAGCTHKSNNTKAVNLAIWGNYLEPDLAVQFEKDTGIKLNISNYSSNEELLAKVQAGAGGIDVAVPSDYMVSVMTKLGLLHKLDKTEIPNFAHLDPTVLHQPFDPGNDYSMPYAWSTAGIAVNRALYKGKIRGWHDVFYNPKLAGKFSLLDDVREVMAVALKYNGYSVNSTNPAELKKAEATLLAVLPKVKMFRSDTVDSLVRKEVAVAHAFSTDALIAASKNPQIEFILPSEGGTESIDNLVIFNGTQHLQAAYRLINFMLSTPVNLSFVKHEWGRPVVLETRALLPEAMQKNAALFPPASALKNFESLRDLGESTRLYDDIWTRVKSE